MPVRKTTNSKPKVADHPLVFTTTESSVTKPRAPTTFRDHPLVFSVIEPRASTKPSPITTSKRHAGDHALKFLTTKPSVTKSRATTTFQGKAGDCPLKFPGTKPRGIIKSSLTKPRATIKTRNHADLYKYLAHYKTRPTKPSPNIATEPFPYQSLPPELRLKILKLTLTDPRAIEMHEYYDDESLVGRCKEPNTDAFAFLFQDPHLCIFLLRVNKDMYAEARAVLYGDNTFRFSSTPIMERFLIQIGEGNRSRIRRVELASSISGRCYVEDVARRCASEMAKMELRHLQLAIGDIWRCNQWYDRYPAIVQDWMPVFEALWLREKRVGNTDEVVAERVFGIVKLPEARAGQCLTSRLHPGGNGNIWSEQCSTCVAEAVRYPESKAAFKELVIENIRTSAWVDEDSRF
ncbi:hypothetical protein BDV97DRAFT_414883 [Delphinella strobiligena]|nr:hypothetical protein BDV97DRAFT_414883 [Delphinella strobiligena]